MKAQNKYKCDYVYNSFPIKTILCLRFKLHQDPIGLVLLCMRVFSQYNTYQLFSTQTTLTALDASITRGLHHSALQLILLLYLPCP